MISCNLAEIDQMIQRKLIGNCFHNQNLKNGLVPVFKVKVKVKFICIKHFMYNTIQSALHKIKALQQGAEKALKICKRI